MLFGYTLRVSANFTRPTDTTPYTVGDLVANSTTASLVVPMSWTVSRGVLGSGGMIRRMRVRKSGTGITKASFRLHLYTTSPVCTNGDNGAWLTDNVATYVGALDAVVDKAFSDGAAGNGVPITGGEINYAHSTLYGLLEARGAYTPGNAEVYTVDLEILPN